MSLLTRNTVKSEGAFVLDECHPEEVAKSIINGRQKEPFFLLSLDEAYNRILHFKEVMPRVQIFYAMKANDWPLLLKLGVSQGVGFDCASPGEISKVLNLGVPPKSIIFALPTKTPEQMKYAREVGVEHTTFDSSYELKKVKQYWPDVSLLIRIRVDGESIYKLGEKFGCDFDTEARNLLDEAAGLNLKVVGVAFHVGSACWSVDSHSLGIKMARMLFDHEIKNGRHNIMKIVDIGGGFMSATTEGIDEVAAYINQALEEHFPDPNVQVIAEPGRYICDSASDLYTSICNVRQINKNNNPIEMIYINDGLHGSLRYVEPWSVVEKLDLTGIKATITDSNNLKDTILWGPTCDSTDRVLEHQSVRLPQCSPFDWLVFKTRGAYAFGFHGPFSSIEIPRMRAVVSKELWAKIRENPVFSSEDFILDIDISVPLPSTLPPLPDIKTNAYINTNVLKT